MEERTRTTERKSSSFQIHHLGNLQNLRVNQGFQRKKRVSKSVCVKTPKAEASFFPKIQGNSYSQKQEEIIEKIYKKDELIDKKLKKINSLFNRACNKSTIRIEKYQKAIIKLFSQKVSEEALDTMEINYQKINSDYYSLPMVKGNDCPNGCSKITRSLLNEIAKKRRSFGKRDSCL